MSEDPIISHYEACLEKHGDNHLGVDWPNRTDAVKRYRVMLDISKGSNATILDYGCGCGHLYDYIKAFGYPIRYNGWDRSGKFMEFCNNKYGYGMFPSCPVQSDYVIMNGVFTEKATLTNDEMWYRMTNTIREAWPLAKKGLAFNVMTSHTTKEKREDLFHLPLDKMAAWVLANLSRNIVIRQDYGLWEYTVYVYMEDTR